MNSRHTTLLLTQSCLGRNYNAWWCLWVKPTEQMRDGCGIQSAMKLLSPKHSGLYWDKLLMVPSGVLGVSSKRKNETQLNRDFPWILVKLSPHNDRRWQNLQKKPVKSFGLFLSRFEISPFTHWMLIINMQLSWFITETFSKQLSTKLFTPWQRSPLILPTFFFLL